MQRSTTWGRGLVVLGLAAALLAPVGAKAESAGREFGMGATCALGSLIYGPAKLLYASGGALVAGMAWAFSGGDAQVAGPILDAAVRGDYVIMPDHLQGRRELEFVGRNPTHEELREESIWSSNEAPEQGVGSPPPEPDTLEEGF